MYLLMSYTYSLSILENIMKIILNRDYQQFYE